jgi:Tfp pilus assembly protein PilO
MKKKLAALEKLGLPGVAGLGLLLFSLSFYLGNLLPAQAELAALRHQKVQLQNEAAARAVPGKAGAGGPAHVLPSLAEVPELLKALNEAATRNGVTITRSSYQLKGRGGQQRLEISLPLRTTYPALRAWLKDAQALAAPATLAELSLQRSLAGEPQIEAQVRLAYAFRSGP